MAANDGVARITLRRGLDIPLAGAPAQSISTAGPVSTVAVLGTDYPGLRPRLLVEVGDRVRLGQPLFESKDEEPVRFTAPGAGEVIAINRGAKRALQSVVVRLEKAVRG